MPTQLQLRRGTTTEHSTFSGAVGEVTVDTTKDTLIVHDGATNGGFPLAKEAGATFGNTNVTGNFSFADNAKAIFGAGSDLQIYHSSNGNSFIQESGTGSLYIDATDLQLRNSAGQNYLTATSGGSVGLRHAGNTKLETTATGIDVTGAISSNKGSAGTLATFTDGVNSNFVVETSSLLTTIGNGSGSAALALKANNTEAMRINSSGKVGIGTASPDTVLDVASSGVPIEIRSTNNNTYKMQLGGSSGYDGYWGTTSSAPFIVANSSVAEMMRIDSSGSVNIGGTGGQAKFEINNAVSTTGSLTDTTINLATTGVTGRKANIGFGLAGGVANTNAATIGFDVTNGAGALQGDLFFSTRGSTGDSVATERMRITSSGQVGLSGGVSSFDTTGSVNGLQLYYETSNGNATIGTYSNGGGTALNFDTNNGGAASTRKLQINHLGKLETQGRDYGFHNHGTTVSLADDASVVINAGTAGGGILAIYETASGQWAVFGVGYNGATIMSALNSANFDVIDTDGRICVISSVHTITIKNRLGGTKGFYINMFMAGNNFAG